MPETIPTDDATPAQSPLPEGDPALAARVFRLPRSAYIAIPLLLFGTAPLAFGDDNSRSIEDTTNSSNFSSIHLGPRALLVLIPIVALIFIARTATFVTPEGIRVRAVLGSRMLPWSGIRGLTVNGRAVYAVVANGAVRLPCVRVASLADVARSSAGHVPQLRDPIRRFAPSRRRR
ncbi:PH domain-containing protein [Jatrophihabitans sp.]|uniref:PH domain-containing protein n=1 Tax=Jatrophihabitans sp. TaxID=1932789 RepID=UPI0030C6BE49|nr:hypothetical protein [Jatrophihabitans sp.]